MESIAPAMADKIHRAAKAPLPYMRMENESPESSCSNEDTLETSMSEHGVGFTTLDKHSAYMFQLK